jgi:hypothetical protein
MDVNEQKAITTCRINTGQSIDLIEEESSICNSRGNCELSRIEGLAIEDGLAKGAFETVDAIVADTDGTFAGTKRSVTIAAEGDRRRRA